MKKHFLIVMSMVYVAFLPQIYSLYNPKNRFVVWWTGTDSAALVAAMLTWTLVVWLLLAAGRKVSCRPGRAGVYRFFIILASAVALAIIFRTLSSILVQSLPDSRICGLLSRRWLRLVLYVLPALILSAVYRERFVRAMKVFLLTLSPAWMLLLIQIPFWGLPAGGDSSLPQILQKSGDGQGDIFMFLFDAWSYERTFSADGRVLNDSMTNLESFAEKSTLYGSAYSPAIATMHSMPRFFFQSGPEIIPHDLLVAQGGHYGSAARTVFDVLDSAKIKPRIAVGFGLDYAEMLSNHVDYAVSVASCDGDRITAGFSGKAKELFLSQLAWIKSVPLIGPPIQKRLFSPIIKEYAYEVVERQFELTADSGVRGVIGFFHYPLPHRPFVWRDGVRLSSFPEDAHVHNVKNYMGNLQGMDYILGKIVAKLKKSGRYDAATIVLMADHNWKQDPDDGVVGNRDEAVVQNYDNDPKHRWKHIPLIIKWPDQTSGEYVANDVFTVELGEFMSSKLRSMK